MIQYESKTQSNMCSELNMCSKCHAEFQPIFFTKKKYFEQEDGVYACQTGKNKYTLLTTLRTPEQLCTTGPEVRRKEIKWTQIVQFRSHAVWFQTETPFRKLYIRARLAVI